MLILIADDEKMIRLSLQSMLEEINPKEHVYLHAPNGQTALSQIEKSHPDLAFLDIRMPLMNGLEVLEQCRLISPSTKWVILSGYADFEYAQKAVSLSVHSYLLKPVDIQTLSTLIDEIKLLKKQEKLQNNKMFSLDIIRTFHNADQAVDSETALRPYETALRPYETGSYILFVFYIDWHKKDEQHTMKQALSHSIETFCMKNQNIIYYSVFFQNTGELSVICSIKDASHLTFYINTQVKTYSDPLISVFYGTSDTLSNIFQISKDIASYAGIRQVYNCQTATSIQKVKEIPALETLLDFQHKIDCFLQHSNAGNMETLRLLKTEYLQNQQMQDCFSILHKDVLCLYLSIMLNHSIKAVTYSDFLRELYLASTKLSLPEPVLNFNLTPIKDFIHQNYSKDISITYISEYYHLSPTYFSRLFHEKTGQKYIDFVTEVRMDAAKEMIKNNPALSVKCVAQAVGYTSVRHFSKIFFKYTGVLPSQYINIEQ